jgi:hypothetical protein
MLVGSVMAVLQPRQQSVDARYLVVERLGELEQRLAQAGPGTLAVAEKFEPAGKLEVIVQVVNRVTGGALTPVN